jgi:class 3 adenylate cyclase
VGIGVASGELISGSIGSRSIGRLDYTVLGPVVAAAAELSVMAARGQILVDEAVAEVAKAMFLSEARGQRALPGGGTSAVYDVLEKVSYNVDDGAQLPTVVMEQGAES